MCCDRCGGEPSDRKKGSALIVRQRPMGAFQQKYVDIVLLRVRDAGMLPVTKVVKGGV